MLGHTKSLVLCYYSKTPPLNPVGGTALKKNFFGSPTCLRFTKATYTKHFIRGSNNGSNKHKKKIRSSSNNQHVCIECIVVRSVVSGSPWLITWLNGPGFNSCFTSPNGPSGLINPQHIESDCSNVAFPRFLTGDQTIKQTNINKPGSCIGNIQISLIFPYLC